MKLSQVTNRGVVVVTPLLRLSKIADCTRLSVVPSPAATNKSSWAHRAPKSYFWGPLSPQKNEHRGERRRLSTSHDHGGAGRECRRSGCARRRLPPCAQSVRLRSRRRAVRSLGRIDKPQAASAACENRATAHGATSRLRASHQENHRPAQSEDPDHKTHRPDRRADNQTKCDHRPASRAAQAPAATNSRCSMALELRNRMHRI